MNCSSREVWPPSLGRQALVVQHNQLFARALARYLGLFYDHVTTLRSPLFVWDWAQQHQLHELDVICGRRFESLDEWDDQWIGRWRRDLPLRRLVIVSAEPLPDSLPGVDAIFPKPLDPSELARFLSLP